MRKLEIIRNRTEVTSFKTNVESFIRNNPPANENDVMMLAHLIRLCNELTVKLATLKRETIKITIDLGTYAAIRVYHQHHPGERFTDRDIVGGFEKQIVRTDFQFQHEQLKTA